LLIFIEVGYYRGNTVYVYIKNKFKPNLFIDFKFSYTNCKTLPIAFFIHERKTKDSLAEFFKHMYEVLPAIGTKCFICTDQEDAFIKGIRHEILSLIQIRSFNLKLYIICI
jgi:hypothetical protein